MISVLSKPLDQIGPGDLQELIDSEVPEGEQIEFKEALSTRDGSPDSWVNGGDLGIRARNEILEEAIAFANAYGGALLLGIAESRGSEPKPPVAAEISPIPRCADLAERLKLVFRDCVEPQIPRVEIVAVPTCGDGGVVVIRTGRSRMAPHRVKPTRKCPIRRADRCEEMTMREIQDLTLNLSRGLERLERRLKQRSERFAEEFNRLETPDCAVGFRATAVPIGEDIQFDRVCREGSLEYNLHEPWRTVLATIGGRKTRLGFPNLRGSWQPMLRSARNEYMRGVSDIELQIYREVYCDGLVEIGLASCRIFDYGARSGPRIASTWPPTIFANLLVWADRVRNQAAAPSVEYAVDIEMYFRGDSVVVADSEHEIYPVPRGSGNRNANSIRFPGPLLGEPRYSLGEQGQVPKLIAIFECDFWNSIGIDVGTIERSFEIQD